MSDLVHPFALLLPRNHRLIRTPVAPAAPVAELAWGPSAAMRALDGADLGFYTPGALAPWKEYQRELANLRVMRFNFVVVHIAVPWTVIGWCWTTLTATPWPLVSALVVALGAGFTLLRSIDYLCQWRQHAGLAGVVLMTDAAERLSEQPELADAAGHPMYSVYRECLVARRGRYSREAAAAILHLEWPRHALERHDLMVAYAPA